MTTPTRGEIMGVLTDPAVYVPDSRGRRVLDEYKATEAIHELIESRTLMQPTKWWRVMGADSHLWAETSSECKARSKMRPGDRLYRQWETVRRTEWREETP